MRWYVWLIAMVAVIGVSASLPAVSIHRPVAAGQVLSVLAEEVPADMIGQREPPSAR